MLDGCTPWPADLAQRYRDRGYWLGITLGRMLATTIRRRPAKTALVSGNVRISYAALGEAVDGLACGFLEAGIAPQDRVVVQLPNVPEFVYTYLALVRIGAIPVMALRAHRHAEVGHFLRASGAVWVRHPRCDQARFRLPGDGGRARAEVRRHCARSSWSVTPGHAANMLCRTLLAIHPRNAGDGPCGTCDPDPAEVATMLLSGGTTSRLEAHSSRTHDDYVH